MSSFTIVLMVKSNNDCIMIVHFDECDCISIFFCALPHFWTFVSAHFNIILNICFIFSSSYISCSNVWQLVVNVKLSSMVTILRPLYVLSMALYGCISCANGLPIYRIYPLKPGWWWRLPNRWGKRVSNQLCDIRERLNKTFEFSWNLFNIENIISFNI